MIDKDSYMPITEEMVEKANRILAQIMLEMIQEAEQESGELRAG